MALQGNVRLNRPGAQASAGHFIVMSHVIVMGHGQMRRKTGA
jgi:hypothetical protein